MAPTNLFNDPFFGTRLDFNDRPNGEATVVITETSAIAPGGKHTVTLDLDEVDNLLAAYEHINDADVNIEEYLTDVHNLGERQAKRAARAFIQSAGSLAEIVYGSAH